MKKQYAILIICLSGFFLPFHSSAQDEVFPTKDAIWNIAVKGWGEMSSYFYGLTGDTIINNLIYNKLYLLNDTLLKIDSEDIYVGGIRQSGKKVYMKPADKSTGEVFEEFLMYDFSVKKGDVVNLGKYPFYYFDFYGLTFDDVNTKYLEDKIADIWNVWDSDLGRSINVSLGGSQIWVEGIGNLAGLFFTQGPVVGFNKGFLDRDEWTKLACLKVGDKIRYQHPDCKECLKNVITGLNKSESYFVKIYQSKSRQLCIESMDPNVLLQFELLDLAGTVLQRQAICGGEKTIDLRVSAPGIYLYRIIGDKIYKSDKIVVQ